MCWMNTELPMYHSWPNGPTDSGPEWSHTLRTIYAQIRTITMKQDEKGFGAFGF